MERRARIELATLAWKAKVIPFYEHRNTVIIQQTIMLVYIVWQGISGSNTFMSGSKPDAFPFGESPSCLVANTRFELVTNALSRHCSTPELIG